MFDNGRGQPFFLTEETRFLLATTVVIHTGQGLRFLQGSAIAVTKLFLLCLKKYILINKIDHLKYVLIFLHTF